MIVSKKEFQKLENKVKEQENIIQNMSYHLVQIQKELNELRQPKASSYFG